jgi:hypothetical protein
MSSLTVGGTDVFHNRQIDALVAAGGHEAARSTYGLERLDDRPIDLTADAIVACTLLRNEADRIPSLLAHHRALGVERFFVVDNGSTDESLPLLLEEADVHVWASAIGFEAENYGAASFDVLLRAYARGHWVVIVDADELLWYPDWETRALPGLCAELDEHGHRALGAVLLDMYARAPITETCVPRGSAPLDVCRYFDRRWVHTMTARTGPFQNQVGLYGGVRRRVFGGRRWDYCLNKVPLVRYDLDTVLVGGQHATNHTLSPTRAAVLHFKFDERLAQYALNEIEEDQRGDFASEYLAYVEALALRPDLTLYDEAESVELACSAQLVDLGVMGPVETLDDRATRAEAFVRLAEARGAAGDRARASAFLTRAAAVLPTSVTPLLRLAQQCAEDGDEAGVVRALDEAAARAPGDLGVLEVADRSGLPGPLSGCGALPVGARPPTSASPRRSTRIDLAAKGAAGDRRPRWATALRALEPLHGDGGVLFDECVDATFGWPDPLRIVRQVHETPWVGCVHAPPEPPEHLPPFARHGLPALWATPALQRSLEHCKGLFTFTERAADWLRRRTDIPVSVVPRPFDPPITRFDLDRFSAGPERQLVQIGWWMTRVNAICDLPLAADNPVLMRKVRATPAAHHRMAVGLARAERERTGWGSMAAILATTDAGPLAPAECARVLERAVVFADLYDANGDPVLAECIASATPILVNRHPAVVEHLGDDYPLYFESPEDAAAKGTDLDAIGSAHHHLRGDDVRQRATPQAFLAAIRDSDVLAGLR